MGLVQLLRRVVGIMWRLTRWFAKCLFYTSLPFCFFPVLNGIFEGIKLNRNLSENHASALRSFEVDIQRARQMDWFSVPGATGIHDTPVQPFHVIKLRNPLDWWKKLKLTRFDVDERRYPPLGLQDVRDFASLNGLYRRKIAAEKETPWHHWMYASPGIFHFEDAFSNGWDEAFYNLIQYHNANPSIASAGFHFLSCPTSFLCKSWLIDGPALLHFTTEAPELSETDQELEFESERPVIPGYEAVTVRVIELPARDLQKLALPPGSFPSHFNQLVGITGNTTIWQDYPPHDYFIRLDSRLASLSRGWVKEYPRTYGLMIKIEDSISSFFDLDESIMIGLARLLSISIGSLINRGVEEVELKFAMWTSKRGEEVLEEEEGDDNGHPMENNLFAQQLRGFFDQLGPETETLVKLAAPDSYDKMWNIARQKTVTEVAEA